MSQAFVCCGQTPVFNDNSITRYIHSQYSSSHHSEPVVYCMKCHTYYSSPTEDGGDFEELNVFYVRRHGIDHWFTPLTLQKLGEFRRLIYSEGVFAADAYQRVFKDNDKPAPIYYYDGQIVSVWRGTWVQTTMRIDDLPSLDSMEYTLFERSYIDRVKLSIIMPESFRSATKITREQVQTLYQFKLLSQQDYDRYVNSIAN